MSGSESYSAAYELCYPPGLHILYINEFLDIHIHSHAFPQTFHKARVEVRVCMHLELYLGAKKDAFIFPPFIIWPLKPRQRTELEKEKRGLG